MVHVRRVDGTGAIAEAAAMICGHRSAVLAPLFLLFALACVRVHEVEPLESLAPFKNVDLKVAIDTSPRFAEGVRERFTQYLVASLTKEKLFVGLSGGATAEIAVRVTSLHVPEWSVASLFLPKEATRAYAVVEVTVLDKSTRRPLGRFVAEGNDDKSSVTEWTSGDRADAALRDAGEKIVAYLGSKT